jgi:hypothetical protein
MFRALFHQRGQLNQTDETEHDPEKCAAVFRKDHAQSKS